MSRYLKANPDLLLRRQRSQEVSRLSANIIETYVGHFDALKKAIVDYAIVRGDCYNMDETGFRMGVGGSQWVVTMDEERSQSASDTNRESCTAIEAVCGDGYALPPFLMLKGKAHLNKWYTNTQIPDNYSVAVSDTGYNNDEITIEWMRHFDNYSSRRQQGVYRLFIFDGVRFKTVK